MDKTRVAISLLALVVIASGCTTGGGDETQGSITVTDFSVSKTQIYEDNSVRASLGVANTGNLPAKIYLGERGEEVMKDYCTDIFENVPEGYSVTTTGEKLSDKEHTYKLPPDREINIRWQLKHKGDAPLYGERCNVEFEVPFDYSAQSYRQVQFKSSREAEASPKLNAESSSGPLKILVETVGSSTDNPSTFVTSDNGRTMTVLFQLVNTGAEGYNKGLIDIYEPSLRLKAKSPLKLNEGYSVKVTDQKSDGEEGNPCKGRNGEAQRRCIESQANNPSSSDSGSSNSISFIWENFGEGEAKCEEVAGNLRMYEGESQVISCNLDIPSEIEGPVQVSEITAAVNYTYLKDVGSRTIRVETRG